MVGSLFEEDDERFIDSKDERYESQGRLDTLHELGMITEELSEKMIIDRAHSVYKLSTIDPQFALGRCKKFVAYLYKERTSIMQNKNLLKQLQDIKFLPVKRRQMNWKLDWGGEGPKSYEYASLKQEKENVPVVFQCPSKLYSETILELVCSLEAVLDNSSAFRH
ncbi:unnamed protein product [Mytilus edulis]|uniref:Uncharacterized protein n=1 Tax=Mytilus edulis TaxID=6550 RepID=A0A8S3V4G4_MYTED|nr:unnamed protein product [Mytilus edulis]